MDATRLLSKRLVLALLVAGELAVVGGMVAAAWHVWQENHAPVGGGVAVSPPGLPPLRGGQPRPSPSPTVAAPLQPTTAPTPGLRTDPLFLGQATVDINREEAAFQQLEWRIAQAATDGTRTYIQRIVLPAISRAQREAGSGRGASAGR
jgi:hypothetical protein